MRKLIYIAAFLVAAAACNSHNGESKTEGEATGVQDTTAVADSVQPVAADTVQKADSVKEVAAAKPESEKKEKAEPKKPSKNAKKIEKDLKWFEHDVKQYKEAVRAGMIGSELGELLHPCVLNEKNLKKYENEMTPEQKARFKKYQKMLNKR